MLEDETQALSWGHSPESPRVAKVSLVAIGGTLVRAIFFANTQRTELGLRVGPGGTALTEEFICGEGTWEISSSYLTLRPCLAGDAAWVRLILVPRTERTQPLSQAVTCHHQSRAHRERLQTAGIGRKST